MFAKQYQLITRDDRLERVAEDLVDHFMGRGFAGKAMVISIDKATAVRMYDKVRKYWDERIAGLNKRLSESGLELWERDQIEAEIRYMEATDMAVVVSQSQNEIKDMTDKGLDIAPHRKRMVNEDLDDKFKDAEDALRLVFLCAMWTTGFDVPSLLDDLPRQADARAHADADHRPSQPCVPCQDQRADRRLRRGVP